MKVFLAGVVVSLCACVVQADDWCDAQRDISRLIQSQANEMLLSKWAADQKDNVCATLGEIVAPALDTYQTHKGHDDPIAEADEIRLAAIQSIRNVSEGITWGRMSNGKRVDPKKVPKEIVKTFSIPLLVVHQSCDASKQYMADHYPQLMLEDDFANRYASLLAESFRELCGSSVQVMSASDEARERVREIIRQHNLEEKKKQQRKTENIQRREENLVEWQNRLMRQEQDLSRRERLADRAAQVSSQESRVNQRERYVRGLETRLKAKEKRLKEKEEELKNKEEILKDLEEKLNAKITTTPLNELLDRLVPPTNE
jgi:hypothetical protein